MNNGIITRENIEYLLQFCTLDECWQLQKIYQPSRLEQRIQAGINPFKMTWLEKREIKKRLDIYVSRETSKKDRTEIKVPFSWLPDKTDWKVAGRWIASQWFHVKQWATVL